MTITDSLRKIGRGLWGSYGDGVSKANELDARFASTGFGSFMHFAGAIMAAGIMYGACAGNSPGSSGCGSLYSGRVSTNGHIDTECFKVNGVKNCGFLQTPNPNKIYYLTGLDDENEPKYLNFRELDSKNVKFRRSDSTGNSGVVNPRTGVLLEQQGEYSIGCVDLDVGEMCGVILPKDHEGIFCDPAKQAYNSQLLGITCYRKDELDTIVNTATRKGPKLVKIIDTRGFNVSTAPVRTYVLPVAPAHVVVPTPVVAPAPAPVPSGQADGGSADAGTSDGNTN